MAISKISANMIDGSLTSSLVTGSLPAVDGSALTGAGAGIDTETTSDPLITSNPSDTGHLWENKTTGKLFICTDNTAGFNVWVNVGGGLALHIAKPFGGLGGGTVSGYVSGGYGPPGFSLRTTMDKFAFASNTTASSHGSLTLGGQMPSGTSSSTHGYKAGGYGHGPGSNEDTLTIEKFAFATSSASTSHGNLSVARRYGGGCSSSTQGFSIGGTSPVTAIDKYDFSSNTTASAHGSLAVYLAYAAGQSSNTDGFASGGHDGAYTNRIEKFSFSSNTTADDHGDLSGGITRGICTGQSSTTHGFSAGGGEPIVNIIDKFSFISNVTATDVGDLTLALAYSAGISSTTDGYTAGGTNVINKFSFASGGNAASHGNLSAQRNYPAGHQV